MADVKDPKIAEGEFSFQRFVQERMSRHRSSTNSADNSAYEKVRDHKDETTWLILDYEVSLVRLQR